MILVSHYSPRFATCLAVTQFLFWQHSSSSHMQKFLAHWTLQIYITHLIYPVNYSRKVWLHNANVDYFSGKHIPLFLVAILFFFLFLPYTFLLLFCQWQQDISHLRLFSWVSNAKLIPSYQAKLLPGWETVVSNHWIGLQDWITGLNLFISHDQSSNQMS